MFPLLMVVVCADRASSLDILDSMLCAEKARLRSSDKFPGFSPGTTNNHATWLILAKLGLDSVRDVKFITIGDAKVLMIPAALPSKGLESFCRRTHRDRA